MDNLNEDKKDIVVNKGKQFDNATFVMNEIILRNVDRTPKDILNWRNALINAESIYYPNRTRLYDLYLDVLLDGHLTGIINKRLDTVLNKSLKFINDDKEVEELESLINSRAFREMCRAILLTQFWGITGFEFIPGEKFEFEEIPRKHIKPELGVIAPEQSFYEGIPYEGASNIWIIGKKREYGLLLQCSPYALFKKGDFADWAQFVEIFGQPIRIGKYDAYDVKTKEQLSAALENAGGSLSIMIPKQADFEIMDGKISNGDGQLQERLWKACNDEMSIIVLGNTETTNNSNGGSNAKAQVHGQQQKEIAKSDMQFVLDYINSPQFISILKSYGYKVEVGRFVYENELDVNSLSQKIIIDAQIKELGIPIDDEYFYETYGIPKPDNYDELKAKIEMEKKEAVSQATENQTVEISPVVKPPKQAKNLAKPVVQLSAWNKLRMGLADFFDQAHND